MCIAHVYLPPGAQCPKRQRWALQQRAFSHMLPHLLSFSYYRCQSSVHIRINFIEKSIFIALAAFNSVRHTESSNKKVPSLPHQNRTSSSQWTVRNTNNESRILMRKSQIYVNTSQSACQAIYRVSEKSGIIGKFLFTGSFINSLQ